MDITYYLTYDSPVPYRNINIFPVTVKDYIYFNSYSQCLQLKKDEIPNPAVITMSELDYIFYATEQDVNSQPYLYWLDRLLAMCIKDDDTFENIEESLKRYGYDKNNKARFTIGKEVYTAKDFEEIKNIISQQNLVELPDKTISKEVRESLEKAMEYKNRLSGTHSGTFEDYIISLSIITGWKLDYIYSMSIRKFVKSIRRIDNLIHYKIYLSASMSGMVEFKDKSFIKHWLVNLDSEDKYNDVSMDLDAIKNKVSLESAKS